MIDPPGATFTEADGINDAGQIVGRFSDSTGATHGFVATPVPETVPEPATLLLFGSCLVGLIWWRRRTAAKSVRVCHIKTCMRILHE
jgi:probable HAF family extracellular repeat protein